MILNNGSGYNDTRNQIDHFIGKSIKYIQDILLYINKAKCIIVLL